MPNNTFRRRQAVRAAIKIHEHLVARARHAQRMALPSGSWEEVCQIIQRLDYSDRKCWYLASQSVARDADYTVRRFKEELDVLRKNLLGRSDPVPVLPAGQIAAELFALESEFENVEFELTEQSFSVLTSGVELEGIFLGPFRIVLTWERIGQAPHPYHVYATEPHHPQDREDITHPHVLDHQLCEGEGAASIKAALNAGRLFDFFVL